MRNRLIFQQTYKKGVLVDKLDVIADAKKSSSIELLKDGKHVDGTEFVVVKINVKPKP